MFSVPQRSKSLIQRCARNVLYANVSQLPRRQQKLAGNSFQTCHYSSSASIPKERHVWTNDEVHKLAEHVNSEYRSRKRTPNWKKVSEHFGIPSLECKDTYFNSYRILIGKEKTEAARNGEKGSRFAVKPVLNMAQKIASSRNNWTTEEVARLREAKGRSLGWHKVAKYIRSGKTADQCEYKWNRLCYLEDIKALGDNQNNTTAPDGPTNTTLRYRGGWTPDELLQLKALFDTPSDPKNPRLHIAYALFPQKTQIQVQYTMDHLHSSLGVQKSRTHALKSKPQLRKLVSDSGGGEKADCKAISKEIGMSALQCQKTYHKKTVAESSNKLWTPDEFDRLLTNLRSQHNNGGAYNWDLAAAAVGTRTNVQCNSRFSRDQKTSKRHLYAFSSLQE